MRLSLPNLYAIARGQAQKIHDPLAVVSRGP